MLVLEGLAGLHRTVQLQLLVRAETWITLILNDFPWKQTEIILSFLRLHFEIASKYCILDSLVDHNGYSISSKGFLPTVVDIIVI